ncbi:MAG: hypothetical protein HQK87_01035 [Nitrospinae bacterium]|nr:hypothetical protein [Nitrospinota bacterium]
MKQAFKRFPRVAAIAVAALLLAPLAASAAPKGQTDREGVYFEGTLLDVDLKKGTGIVNLGLKQGMNKGDRLVVVQKGKRIVNPKTGEFIRVKQIEVCVATILAANDSHSDVKLQGGKESPKRGDYVRTRVAPPQALKAVSPTFRRIEISWEYDAQPEIAGYTVYRSFHEKGPYEKIGTIRNATEVTYVDEQGFGNELKDSTVYYYTIETVNNFGVASDKSAPVRGATMAPPAPPASFKAEGDVRAVKLTWKEHSQAGVAGYRVYRRGDRADKWELLKDIRNLKEVEFWDYGTDGSKTSPKLNDATTYWYTVAAYSKYQDEGSHSDARSATTLPPPRTPIGLEGRGWQPRQIPLSWRKHSDENVRGYYLYRSMEEGGPYQEIAEIKDRDKTEYLDNGKGNLFGDGTLKDFTVYFYKIAAYNWAGSKSDLSAAISATTKAAPLAPEEVRAISNRPRQIPLTWRKNPEVDLHHYEIYKSDTAGGEFGKLGQATAEQPYFLDDRLKDGVTCWYKVRAIDKYGIESDYSPTVSASTKSVPAKVGGLSYDANSGQVYLKWARNPEVDIDHYNVYVKSFLGFRKLTEVKETFFIIKGMKRGDKDDYAIAAVDVDGIEGERSGVLTVDLR